MSHYALSDFSETVNHYDSPIKAEDIEHVLAAWGSGFDEGEDSGTEWEGGFLLRLKDQRILYICGWNDYTGWGCQDGIAHEFFEVAPDRHTLTKLVGYPETDLVPNELWDEEPADLNRWIEDGADADKAWV